MSNTINKVRVNGVLYDLAGSGGGSTTGGYLIPTTVLTKEALGYTSNSVTFVGRETFLQWITECGIDLDEVFIDGVAGETYVILEFGHTSNNDNGFCRLHAAKSSESNNYYITLDLCDSSSIINISQEIVEELTIRQTINLLFESLIEEPSASLLTISDVFGQHVVAASSIDNYINMAYIYRQSIDYYEYYPTVELEYFIDNVIQEYEGGSSSSV